LKKVEICSNGGKIINKRSRARAKGKETEKKAKLETQVNAFE